MYRLGGAHALVVIATVTFGLALAAPAAALEQRLVASDGAAGDGFGESVAVDGDTAVVGAPFADAPNANQGAAYVFTRRGDSWIQTAKLTAGDGTSNDVLGFGWRSTATRADR